MKKKITAYIEKLSDVLFVKTKLRKMVTETADNAIFA